MPQLSAIEILRESNLKNNKEVLSKLLAELKEYEPIKPRRKKPVPKKEGTRNNSNGLVMRRNPSRNARYEPLTRSPPMTRSRSRRGSISSCSSTSTSASSSPNKEHRLLVRLGAFGRPRSFNPDDDSIDVYDNEDEESKRPARVRRLSSASERVIRPPEDITKEELEMVAQNVGDKSYDTVHGTTCHQCRQKTIDMKTICRNEDCHGVRGQFCGVCLRNRYGEDVQKALKDPDWYCPPCRDICNCSICRRRTGRASTGILIHLARERGFEDVNSFLASLKKS